MMNVFNQHKVSFEFFSHKYAGMLVSSGSIWARRACAPVCVFVFAHVCVCVQFRLTSKGKATICYQCMSLNILSVFAYVASSGGSEDDADPLRGCDLLNVREINIQNNRSPESLWSLSAPRVHEREPFMSSDRSRWMKNSSCLCSLKLIIYSVSRANWWCTGE